MSNENEIAKRVAKEIEIAKSVAEEYDSFPQEVKDILDTWDEDGDEYKECARIYAELNLIGWTCDYYLDGIIFDVKEKPNG